MPWMAPAAIAGSNIVAGAMGADAAGKASDAQQKASQASIAEQRRQYDLARSDNAPFRTTGVAGNARLAQLLGISPATTKLQYNGQTYDNADALRGVLRADYVNQLAAQGRGPDQISEGAIDDVVSRATPVFSDAGSPGAPDTSPLLRRFTADDLNADPVYQSGLKFGLDEGAKGINARAMQAGGYDSGATLKALTRFGTDYGSTKANESYNRFTNDQNNVFNRLSGVSGSGQVATNTVTAAGTNAANNVSGSIDAAGNARAAGIVGGANAWGGALTGGVNAVNSYQNNKQLLALLGGRVPSPISYDPSQYAG
jgi:hypothetical protein